MSLPPEIGPYVAAFTKIITKIWQNPKWAGLIAIPLVFLIDVVECKYGSYAQAAVAMLLWFLLSHKNPNLSPVRKLHVDTISGNGFTFHSLGRKRPSFLGKVRDESGLLWEGFSIGVCKPNPGIPLNEGKVYSIGVWLYGTNEGVGHYLYQARSNTFNRLYGEGHFNLMPFEAESDLWETRVRLAIANSLARDLEDVIRPIDVAYDQKTGKLTMYDPESSRYVYPNEDRQSPADDLFVFGPSTLRE